jgi:S-DNA-T family DNA segregation ATPase FtsK/SpoIIIE
MSMIKKSPPTSALPERETFTPRSRQIGLCIALGVLVLLTVCALISYSATDSSFIYDSSKANAPANWLGSLGAYWASFLLYMFGSSSWLLVGIMLYILRIKLFQLAWKRELDRVAALVLFVFIATGISSYYGFEWYNGIYPGGLCGIFTTGLMHICFSEPHQELFLFIVTWALWIIIARFSCIVYLYPIGEILAKIPLRESLNRLHVACTQTLTRLVGSLWPGATTEVQESRLAKILEEFKEDEEKEPEEAWVAEQKPNTRVLPASKTTALTDDSEETSTPCEAGYQLPSSDLFPLVQEAETDADVRQKSEERAKTLEDKLERFGIKGKITSITQGPVVTLFEYQPSIDTRINTIVAREDDLALALQALSLRIIAPIPGRSVVGLEVAHTKRKPVLFSHIIKNKSYTSFKGLLPLILGKDTLGAHVIIDLASCPHLLVAGSTGSGKSVGLHGMLISLLCSKTPDEVRLILIDPKRLEFSAYADIAHLVFPVVTDPKRAITVLKWAVETMENRYAQLSEAGARNATDYNKKKAPTDEDYMPYLVIVIDELADLMMTAGKEVEFLIARLAQMARAAGIHLITATQRPSVDVITGLIKVNFPTRIAYKVISKVDSRTILDMTGAEKLLGKGDMLFLDSKGSVQRVHGSFVTDEEIASVIAHIKAERDVQYQELVSIRPSEATEDSDELLQDVITYLQNKDEISISLLQRVFRVGYNRSARIIDQLEEQGYILPADGGKMRKVTKHSS